MKYSIRLLAGLHGGKLVNDDTLDLVISEIKMPKNRHHVASSTLVTYVLPATATLQEGNSISSCKLRSKG